MTTEQDLPETKGVTVELLSVVELGRELPGMEGRQLAREPRNSPGC